MGKLCMTPSGMALAAGLATVLALAGAGLGGCAKKPAPVADDRANARSVRVGYVESRALSGGMSASGVLISREEAAVNPELSGYRVAKVFVEVDATVRQGEPLAQLDDTLLKAQIAQQTALVAQQQVAAEQADKQAKDVADLDNMGIMAAEQIDQRRFQARSSRAALAAQTAQLNDLKTRDERLMIRAPVAGLVLERNVRPGDISSSINTTPMFRMARDSLVELEAQIDEGSMAGVRIGDEVQVSLPDGASITGHVRLINPSVDPQTKLGKVRVALPVRPDLRPGGFARATFVGMKRTVPCAPETAVRYDANGASMMVVGADNRVSQVPVRTGDHAGGYAELLQGPPAGSRVLLGAAAFVLPGDAVKPVGAGSVEPTDARAGR
jgi:HlyD family secretion protein